MTQITMESLSIKNVTPSIIPSIFDVKAHAPNGLEVLFEYHREMELSYKEGEEISLKLSSQKIPPKNASSFCGKAMLYTVKQKEGLLVYLFSAGGLILRISSPKQLEGLEIASEYYFCIDKT